MNAMSTMKGGRRARVLASFAAVLVAPVLSSCQPCPCRALILRTGGTGGGATVAAGGGGGGTVVSTHYDWKNVVILGGGFVSGIIFSPVEKGLVYARTDVGGAYRWNGADSSWIPLTDEFGRADSGLTGIESMAPDPVDANRVYAAVGTYVKSWAPNGAMLRSSDRGNTWARTDMPIKMGGNEYGRSNGERLAIDPNLRSTLYFGSRADGLWKSTDASATWNKVAELSGVVGSERIQRNRLRRLRQANRGPKAKRRRRSTPGSRSPRLPST